MSNNELRQTTFTSNYCKLANGKRPNFTYFFRNDLHWKEFTKYLDREYKHAPKVNIYIPACSDGTEACTLAISLFERFGIKKAKKFTPIHASDIDKQIIENAKSGNIPLLPKALGVFEKIRIKIKTLFCDKKYLKYNQIDGKSSVSMNSIIKKNITFKTANIFDEIPKMKRENSVVMCRNMWMYLSDKEQKSLAIELGNRLETASICVLGEYDKTASKAVEYLNQNGFMETYVTNVFEKMI